LIEKKEDIKSFFSPRVLFESIEILFYHDVYPQIHINPPETKIEKPYDDFFVHKNPIQP